MNTDSVHCTVATLASKCEAIAGSVGRNRGAVYRIDPSEVFAAHGTVDEAGELEPAADATST